MRARRPAVRSGPPVRRGVRGGLVVGRVHDPRAVGLQAVAERHRGVVEVRGVTPDVVELELALDQVVEVDSAPKRGELTGK